MKLFVKNITTRNLRRVLAILLLIVVASSCEHKPLCWHHPHTGMLRVDFAWWDAPEGEDLVKSMALYVYPKDGSENNRKRIDFVGTSGGIIELNVGDYNFLCLNSDTETLQYDATDAHHSFSVYTRDAHPLAGMEVRSGEGDFDLSDSYENIKRAEGTEKERVSREAEDAYGHAIEDVHVHGEAGVMQVVTLYPKNLTVHFHVVLQDVGCIETVQKISGTLSGLAGKVKVADATRVGDHNIVPFSLLQTGEHTLEGHFIAFGHCPDDIEKFHKIAVYAVTEEDDHLFFEFDVSDQIEKAKDQRYITIFVKGLDICGMKDMGVVVDPWLGIPPIIVPME
ncbi:MAG: DUF5119 domain-containing protein [Paramuribaculum sp.]|nr:DUF5119 domain-containing protein [Paramuribaculum sp.]MDE6459245.1 DUF5119 domain-containing protein [Paramuribaculum sp.]